MSSSFNLLMVTFVISFSPKIMLKLSATQNKSCEGLTTQDELWLPIHSFQIGKTPGLDGIPLEIMHIKYSLHKNVALNSQPCASFLVLSIGGLLLESGPGMFVMS